VIMRSAVMLQLTCSHVRPDHGSHLVPVQSMVNMVRASDRIHCDKTTKRYSCCGQYDSCETMFQIPIAVWIPAHNDRGITQCRARRAAFARRVAAAVPSGSVIVQLNSISTRLRLKYHTDRPACHVATFRISCIVCPPVSQSLTPWSVVDSLAVKFPSVPRFRRSKRKMSPFQTFVMAANDGTTSTGKEIGCPLASPCVD
jgi:hypothetical protein